jgi:hypothetical protein
MYRQGTVDCFGIMPPQSGSTAVMKVWVSNDLIVSVDHFGDDPLFCRYFMSKHAAKVQND